MRDLVLGSEGFVGKPLCEYLEKLGEEVIRFDIKRSNKEDLGFEKLPLEGVDRIYFLAWDVGGAKYLYNLDTQFGQLDWNLRLMINVMPQIQESGIPFLFVSSQLAEEYDTVYGSTKRMGEVWTHLLGGIRIRLWNVYGPLEEPSQRTHVVSDLVYQAFDKGSIEMLTTGDELRQFIHIDDVCRAFHLAFEMNVRDVYDVTSFEWVPVMEVARIIAKETGATIIPGKRKGNTPITPMRGRIPRWLPEIDLETGLKKMIDELRTLKGLKR